MSPSPITRHQRTSRTLLVKLIGFIEHNGLGEMFYAPYDVILSDQHIVQPDLLFVSKNRQSIITEKNIQGAPDFIVEILSEHNRRQDEIDKRKVYEQFGVQEYWIVDPEVESVKIYQLKECSYKKPVLLSKGADDHLESKVLPGFRLPLAGLFPEVL